MGDHMTAYMAVAYPDRVEVLSDGAICGGSGALLGVRLKVEASKRLPFALIGRGQSGELKTITDPILEATEHLSVDETIAAIAESLAGGSLRKQQYDYEVAIFAISETLGPANYMFSSRGPFEAPFGMLEPYTIAHWGGPPLAGGALIGAEDFSDADFKRLHVGLPTGLKDVGIIIFEAMRRKSKEDLWGQGAAYWIGGALYHTVIDMDGVRTETIHKWPDEIFKKIKPEDAP